MFFLFQKFNQKSNTRPIVSKNLNYQTYIKWCKEMKTEISDLGRLNHITMVPPATTNEQWEQNDSMVISWIIENIDRDHIDCFLGYTTTAHELWTIIQFILGPTNFATSRNWTHSAWGREGRNRDKGEESKENRGDHSTTAHGPSNNGRTSPTLR